MTLNFIPVVLPAHLEDTVRVLFERSVGRVVYATPRQLVEALGLKSPAPLYKRLERLAKLGVITYNPA